MEPAPRDDCLVRFGHAVDDHRLREQTAIIADLSADTRKAWLEQPQALTLLLEHCHQRRDLRRATALAWRLRRYPEWRADALFHEIRRHRWFRRDSHALALLDREAALVQQHPSLRAEEILTLCAVRRIRSARQRFEAYCDTFDPVTRLLLEARLLSWEDRRLEAAALLAGNVQCLSTSPDAWSRRLHLALENGTLDLAAELAHEAVATFAESFDTLLPAARIAEVRDDRELAADLFRRALELSPDGHYAGWISGRLEFLTRLVDPAVLLSVPTLRQHRAYCGPNSLSLLARFWGREVEQSEIAREIWDDGTSLAQMWQWAERHGFETHVFRASPERIRALLDLGIPSIVERSWEQSGHFFIFIGYSRDGSELYLRDPDSPELVRYAVDSFDRLFCVQDGWTCAFWPADSRPPGVAALDWPGESTLRAVNQIAHRLGSSDPRNLASSLDALDEAEAPHSVALARLAVADALGDVSAARAAGKVLLERQPEQPAIKARVLHHWFRRLPADEVKPLSHSLIAESSHPHSLSLHVSLCCRTGDYPAAREGARRLRVLHPGAEETALATANYLIDVGNEERAIASLEIGEEVSRGGPYFLARLSQSLINVGHFQRVEGLLARALERRPNYDFAHWLRALCHERSGNLSQAIEAYRANLDRCPWYTENYTCLASLFEDAGRHDEALVTLLVGRERASNARSIRHATAEMHLRQNRLAAARDEFAALVAIDAEDIAAIMGLARVALREADSERARGLLGQVLALAPDHTAAIRELANLEERAGNRDAAIALLWDYVRRNPASKEVDLVLTRRLDARGRVDEWIQFVAEVAQQLARPEGAWLRIASVLHDLDRPRESRPWIERAIDKNPEDAWSHSLLGDHHFALGDFDAAEAKYRRAIELWPNYVWALERLTKILAQKRDPEALAMAHAVVRSDAGRLSVLLDTYQALGRDAEAYEYLQAHAHQLRVPHNVETYCALLQKSLGNLDRAVEHIDRACVLAPADAWPRTWRALILEQSGRLEEAEADYRHALELSPQYSWCRRHYRDFLLGLDRKDEALRLAQEGFRLDPNDGAALKDLQELYVSLHRPDDAEIFLAPFEGVVQRPADLWCQISIAHGDCRAFAPAVRAAERALELDPRSSWAWRLLGLRRLDLAEIEPAIAALTQSSDVNPSDFWSWRALAELHRDRGEYEKSLAWIRHRHAWRPTDDRIYVELFETCRAGGLWAEGERWFTELGAGRFDEPERQLYLGRLREAAGDATGALAAYDTALELAPTMREALLQRSKFMRRLGRRQECRRDLETLLALEPAHTDALEVYISDLDSGDAEQVAGATALLERALSSSPDTHEIYGQINRLSQRTGDPARLVYLFEAMRGRTASPATLEGYIGTAFLDAGRLDEAEVAFRQATAINPHMAWGWSRLGDLERARGRIDEAIRLWEQAIARNPRGSYPYTALAEVACERGDPEARWSALSRRLATDPDNPDFQSDLEDLAAELSCVDRFEEFVRSLLPASRAPNELMTRLAYVLQETGQTARAIEACDEAIRWNPRDSWAHAKRATFLRLLDRHDEALTAAEASLAILPSSAEAAIQRYLSLCATGRSAAADAGFFDAIPRAPRARRLFDVYVNEHEKRRPAEAAARLLEHANAVMPTLDLLLAASRLLIAGRKIERAFAIIDRVCHEYPQEAAGYFRGVTLANEKNRRGRLETFAMLGLTTLSVPRLELVEWLVHDTNREWFARAVRARRFRRGLASCRSEEELHPLVERCRSQRSAYARLAQVRPSVLAVRVAISDLHQGKFRRARQTLEAVLRLRAGDVPALTVLANVAIQLGDGKAALECLQRTRRAMVDGEANRWHDLAVAAHLLVGNFERAQEAARASWRRYEVEGSYWPRSLEGTCRSMALAHARRGQLAESREWAKRHQLVASDRNRRRLRWRLLLARCQRWLRWRRTPPRHA
ncbi:MAG: tetratricopeptide repeat protein [Planctomycetota bacterium]